MRWLSIALIALLALLQYPLWLGKGGWLRVWDVDQQLQQQRDGNRKLEIRNAGLDAEVRDLKDPSSGGAAIEERARDEFGLIKPGETFYRVVDDRRPAEPAPSEAPEE